MLNTKEAQVKIFEPAELATDSSEKTNADSCQHKIIVIGSGPVGLRFCHELLKRNPLARIQLFGNEPFNPYNRVQLTALLAGEVARDDIDIPLPSADRHPNFGFRISAISRIDKTQKQVEDANGNLYDYDTLVMATGARAHVPNIPGVDQAGVYTFRNLKDTEHLFARIARSRNVVVVGGGLLGLEAAKGMLKASTRVTLVQQGAHLMNRQLDPAGGDILRKEIEKTGIQVVINSGVREVMGEDRVESVRTNSGDIIPCDTLILCAGIKPNIELARKSGIAVRTGIVVSDKLQTSDDNIYAIGECCEHNNQTYGIVSPGFEQAAVAAELISEELSGNKTDTGVNYAGSLYISNLKVVGHNVASMGELNDLPSRPFQSQLSYRQKKTGQYRKLAFYRGRLMGAAAIGDWPEQARIQEAYQQRRYFWPWQRLWFRLTGNLWQSGQTEDISQWPENAIVCQCNNLSLGALVAAMDDGHSRLSELQAATRAGTVCGSCKPLLNQLIGSDVVSEKEKGWLPLVAGSLVAMILALGTVFVPEAQVSQTFQAKGWFEGIWNDKFWKQVTGFTLLGLSVLGLLLSLRKRLGFEWMGGVFFWRVFHTLLGAACAGVLILHSGFHIGSNLNRFLLIDFLGILILGACTGLVISLSHHMRPIRARSTRKLWSWVHILFTWPLPALLAAHIISVYYF